MMISHTPVEVLVSGVVHPEAHGGRKCPHGTCRWSSAGVTNGLILDLDAREQNRLNSAPVSSRRLPGARSKSSSMSLSGVSRPN
jgi:hypothetical protein